MSIRRQKSLLFLFAGFSALLCVGFAYADLRVERADREGRIPGQYIVVFHEDVGDVEAAENEILARNRGEKMESYRSVLQGFSARFADADAVAIASDPRVAFVSEDRVVSINAREDFRFEMQSERLSRSAPSPLAHTGPTTQAQNIPTGISRINAVGKTNTGAGVHVAVVDTGILATHPDLAGKIVGGKNCTRASGGHTDQNGHGTHVAGTIAASNNSVGVVGVAPGVKLWSVRVLDRFGNGTWSSVICGLDFVASKAPSKGGLITVANLSLGGGGSNDNNCGNSNNDALHKAICRARDAGVTIVVAAGNSGANTSGAVPAAYDDAVITVSALADSNGTAGGGGAATSFGADDTFASFSNYGTAVDIGAPGVNINSTWISNTYKAISGTSMASPHVAGAAALYIATHSGATWTQVRDALVSLAEPLGAGHSDPSGKHPEPVLRADSL